MGRLQHVRILVAALSILVYCYLAFFCERYQTLPLLLSFTFLFACYTWILSSAVDEDQKFWFIIAIAVRVLFVFSLPALSDDVYRFLWDGRLLANGIHPFAHVPSFYIDTNIQIDGISRELFDKLNSPDYFTIYPPVAQFLFWVSAIISPHSVTGGIVVIKVFVLLADVLNLVLLKKLLRHFGFPSRKILIYAINPLVILEFAGNLHLEVFAILFVLCALYAVVHSKTSVAALALSLAVCVKLLPVILVPAFARFLSWKQFILLAALSLLFCVILFTPLLSMDIVHGLGQSVGYYFRKFEFNASVYYLVREAGYILYGYNIIQTVGWKLGAVCGASIVAYYIFRYYQLKRKTDTHDTVTAFFTDMLFISVIYLLFTTTVHPWYVLPLIAYASFTSFRFPIAWSYLIFFTYSGYSQAGFKENLWLTALEYAVVLAILLLEIRTINRSRGVLAKKHSA